MGYHGKLWASMVIFGIFFTFVKKLNKINMLDYFSTLCQVADKPGSVPINYWR